MRGRGVRLVPNRMNDAGTIAGASGDTAAVYQNGKLHVLSFGGTGFSYATGVNNHNDVVGYYYVSNDQNGAFLYRDGKVSPAPGGQINDRGQVVASLNGLPTL